MQNRQRTLDCALSPYRAIQKGTRGITGFCIWTKTRCGPKGLTLTPWVSLSMIRKLEQGDDPHRQGDKRGGPPYFAPCWFFLSASALWCGDCPLPIVVCAFCVYAKCICLCMCGSDLSGSSNFSRCMIHSREGGFTSRNRA
jgi:hypothetical protein